MTMATTRRTVGASKRIKCAECRYVRVDNTMSERDWKAYECCNPDSLHYKALLNVTVNGERQSEITWSGCEHGRRGDGA